MATQKFGNYQSCSFNHGSGKSSPVFSTQSTGSTAQWKMEYMYPPEERDHHPSMYSSSETLHLWLVDGLSSADIYYSVKVLYYNGGKLESLYYSGTTIVKRGECVNLRADYPSGWYTTTATQHPSTTLELCVLDNTLVSEVPTDSTLASALSSTLDSDQGFNDVTLYFGQENKPLQVSKFMLMARSPVFKAMFQSDFKEAKDSTAKIEDISPEVGQEMITYMYTDKTPNISTMPEELWQAAEKYQLPGLKALCENELDRQLNKDTAARILLFTGQYNGEGVLRDCAVNLITQNKETYTHVKKSKEWEEVIKYPELLLAISDKFFAEPAQKRARLS